MASSVKTYPDDYTDGAADQTLTDLEGLPSIPSNAVLNSVILSFTCTRTHGRDDNEIRVQLGDTRYFYIQDLGENDSRTCDITSIVKNNGGTLSYINGTTSLKLYGYHEFRLFYNANWDLTNIKITANYTIPTYTVTWKNGDTVLETDTGVEHGTTPTYNGSTPTKASTAQYSYTFSGWSPAVGAISGNTTYTAQFTATTRKYTVTWKNGDTVLETDTNVPYGTTPTYNGSTPTKASTAQYSYTFKGWSPAVGAISGNTTYTAQFTETVRKYNVNFKNQDGSVVKTLANVAYGTTLGTLPTVSRSGYTFAGWIPCEPAKKTDGTVLDSYKYNGDNAYPLDTKYKYTDKFSIHIEAYMSNWTTLKTLNAQIMSCTEGGGWGLGYQARSGTTAGTEIYNGSGYKVIDLGFGTDDGLKALNGDNNWHSIDLVFSNGTYKAYLDGVEKGTQTLSSTSLSYNSSNTIFVGAEASANTTTPNNGYFQGYISNVFIANKGTRLVAATTSTVVEGNVDYYPIWRLNVAPPVYFKNLGDYQCERIYIYESNADDVHQIILQCTLGELDLSEINAGVAGAVDGWSFKISKNIPSSATEVTELYINGEKIWQK